jgi:hypothetical protein
MAGSTERTDPELWDKVKAEITAGDKGGDKGEWSARKAQMAVQEYKRRGGGYRGRKTGDNHLVQWTKEDWGTRSGKKSEETGERYLPRAAREKLTKEEHARTTAKKRADTRAGRQHSAQPKDVARKTAAARHGGGHAPDHASAGRSGGRKAPSHKAPARTKSGSAPKRKAPKRS